MSAAVDHGAAGAGVDPHHIVEPRGAVHDHATGAAPDSRPVVRAAGGCGHTHGKLILEAIGLASGIAHRDAVRPEDAGLDVEAPRASLHGRAAAHADAMKEELH